MEKYIRLLTIFSVVTMVVGLTACTPPGGSSTASPSPTPPVANGSHAHRRDSSFGAGVGVSETRQSADSARQLAEGIASTGWIEPEQPASVFLGSKLLGESRLLTFFSVGFNEFSVRPQLSSSVSVKAYRGPVPMISHHVPTALHLGCEGGPGWGGKDRTQKIAAQLVRLCGVADLRSGQNEILTNTLILDSADVIFTGRRPHSLMIYTQQLVLVGRSRITVLAAEGQREPERGAPQFILYANELASGTGWLQIDSVGSSWRRN